MSGSSAVLTVASPFYFDADFTVECWAELDVIDGTDPFPRLFTLFPADATTYTDAFLDIALSGGFYMVLAGRLYGPAPMPSVGQWQHFAVTRAGSAVSFYIDGAIASTASYSGDIGTPTAVFRIGGSDPQFISQSQWQGSIADFRVVKGTALYT